MKTPTLECFPCILVVTDIHTNKLEYCNQYGTELLNLDSDKLMTYGLFDIISKASSIFFESYIRPTIVSTGSCQEVQISLTPNTNEKVASVANAKLADSKIYWSIYVAVARDKLYQELLSAREHLEAKTEELTLLTRVDPLTSLLNRRAAIDDFNQKTNELDINFTPTSILLIDIDWFKKINDIYGHDRGDEVLITLSQTLKRSTNASDIVARWGGEEFLVILNNSNTKDTQVFCQKLHIEASSITLSGSENLSISIGGSNLEENNLTKPDIMEKYIKQADIALYEAKAKGRSRTEFFDHLHLT
ncbi:GGDEF domain-containing protein [Marinomonas sp. C2222]|uniref:diguanylate cyclase n=1 Tax=Marinomonas sargassi TaxID=2984494 RepID=A0ABT2YNU2_9GAMM|nr:GGDEF domain-containing protein [Marinomonas sargassi]MCV2401559.1 GGDEF domain-containing protein [Marinomonas sargassi]